METISIRDNIRWVKCDNGKVITYNLMNNQILELDSGLSSFLWEAIAETRRTNAVAKRVIQVYCSDNKPFESVLSDIRRALCMLQNLELIDLETID